MQSSIASRTPLKSLENLNTTNLENSVDKTITVSKDIKRSFNSLIKEGRRLQKEDELEKALQYYLDAKKIIPDHEKLNKKILSIQTILNRLNQLKQDKYGWFYSDDGKEHMLDPKMRNPYILPSEIYNKLYGYQKESVKWMWNLFKKKTGGVLGDDMGLGKTVQVCSFLRGLIHSEFVDKILLILPLSIMSNWEKEIKKWCGDVPIVYYHGSKSARERNLRSVLENSGIVLTTYGTVQTNYEALCEYNGETINWDVIILDEGHNIKNPSKKTTKAVNCLSSRSKIVLTGTPIMNNLTELWSLFNFCCDGQLLGDLSMFKSMYAIPISEGNMKNATPNEVELGVIMANRLRTLIEPHFLRREKSEVLELKTNNERKSLVTSPKPKINAKKIDLICWIRMTDLQISLYKNFLMSEATTIDDKLISKRTPFEAILALKNISLHPSLLQNHSEYSETLDLGNVLSKENIIEQSGKLIFLVELLKQLKRENHKVLIFSQRVAMLNIIQRVLKELHYSYARIDGNIKEAYERQCIVDNFNNSTDLFALLLTTKVGGVGLNLTSADRVIIYDPSWNLATDDQSVDRAYRIGQKKDVVIYRLMTCGTIEEKIYRRQIFKGSLSQTMTSKVQQHFGYFSKGELRDMFEFDEEDAKISTTHLLLSQLIAVNLSNEEYREQISKLENIDVLYGVSDHSLLFTDESNAKLKEISRIADSEGFDSIFDKISDMNIKTSKDFVDAFERLSLKTKTPYKERKKRNINKEKTKRNKDTVDEQLDYFNVSNEETSDSIINEKQKEIEITYIDSDDEIYEKNNTPTQNEKNNLVTLVKEINKESTDVVGILSDDDIFDDTLLMENKSAYEACNNSADVGILSDDDIFDDTLLVEDKSVNDTINNSAEDLIENTEHTFDTDEINKDDYSKHEHEKDKESILGDSNSILNASNNDELYDEYASDNENIMQSESLHSDDEYYSIEYYSEDDKETDNNSIVSSIYDENDEINELRESKDAYVDNEEPEVKDAEDMIIGKNILNEIEKELLHYEDLDNISDHSIVSEEDELYDTSENDDLHNSKDENEYQLSEIEENSEDDDSIDQSDVESFDGEIDEKSLILQRLMNFDDSNE